MTNRREHTRFQRGSGCFACRVCDRQSRQTAVNAGAGDICPQCFDLAGIENAINDGAYPASDARAEVLRLTTELSAKHAPLTEWADLVEKVTRA